jgi:hypothetical protein
VIAGLVLFAELRRATTITPISKLALTIAHTDYLDHLSFYIFKYISYS